MRGLTLHSREVKSVFKTWLGTPAELRKLRKPKLSLPDSESCCLEWLKREGGRSRSARYLVMGKKGEDGEMETTYIVPWTKNKVMSNLNETACAVEQQAGSRVF